MPIVLEMYNEEKVRIYGGYIIHDPVDRYKFLRNYNGLDFEDVDIFVGDTGPVDYIGDIDGFRFSWAQTDKFGILTIYDKNKSRVRREAAKLVRAFDLVELDVAADKFMAAMEKHLPKPNTA